MRGSRRLKGVAMKNKLQVMALGLGVVFAFAVLLVAASGVSADSGRAPAHR